MWDLLADAYDLYGPVPTLLERDFNLPPLPELLDEVRHIKRLQETAGGKTAREASGG